MPLCTHSLNWDANSQRSELVVDWHSFTMSSMNGLSPISLIKFFLTELLSILPSLICEQEPKIAHSVTKTKWAKCDKKMIEITHGFNFFIDARQQAFPGAALLQFMGYVRLYIFIGGFFLVLTFGCYFHLIVGHSSSLEWSIPIEIFDNATVLFGNK